MDDGTARRLGQLADGDQRGDRARAHRLAALVHGEAAVGVAVEGQAEVGALDHHALLQVHEVGRVERVGLVVGEGAVELEVERHEVDADEIAEHGGHGVAAHAVARVDDDLERPDAREVDEATQVGGVVGEEVALGDPAAARPGGHARLHGRPDRRESGVLADRRGARAAHLDAVVAGRVVARGEHRAG